jgi:hypothetical protein
MYWEGQRDIEMNDKENKTFRSICVYGIDGTNQWNFYATND